MAKEKKVPTAVGIPTKVGKKEKDEKKNIFKNHPIIKGPRITEKAALGIDRNQYTFNINNRATKNEIKKAIKTLYKVDAVKVNITKVSSEKVFVRGRAGRSAGHIKATVFLKKGDKIDIAM